MSYAVVMIKPLSVGRGQGPHILENILVNTNVVLRKFRPWRICNNTWLALEAISQNTESAFSMKSELEAGTGRNAWVCLFKAVNESVDPRTELNELFGPNDPKKWLRHHLRHRFSAISHTADNVVYMAPVGKEELVAQLLFENFSESDV